MAWYTDPVESLTPTPTMELGKRAWRGDADRILGLWDAYLEPDPDACMLTTELHAVFNWWLKANGHNTWPKETFGSRFISHEETARHRVERRRQLNPKGLDRGPTHQQADVPRQPEVYVGLRWKRDS
jgi:hypothetical protein